MKTMLKEIYKDKKVFKIDMNIRALVPGLGDSRVYEERTDIIAEYLWKSYSYDEIQNIIKTLKDKHPYVENAEVLTIKIRDSYGVFETLKFKNPRYKEDGSNIMCFLNEV